MSKRPLSNRLKVLRAERRLVAISVARRLGTSTGRYSQIENGHVDPSDHEIKKLARIFDVDQAELGFTATQVASAGR